MNETTIAAGATIIFTVQGRQVSATWTGGPHIAIGEPGDGLPFDTIGVWDHETDTLRIPATVPAMWAELSAWADALDPDDVDRLIAR